MFFKNISPMRNVVFFALSVFACFVVFIVSLQKSLPSAVIFIYFFRMAPGKFGCFSARRSLSVG